MGAFDLLMEGLEKRGIDIERPTERDAVLDLVGGILGLADRTWMLVAPTPKGKIPVGVIGERSVDTPAGKWIEPHVTWFPWASPRNKVETILKYLQVRRFEVPMLIIANRKVEPFFRRMKGFGVLAGPFRLPGDPSIHFWGSR